VPTNPEFNANVRQLLHVSFKVAAKQGSRYTDLLDANRDIVARQVTGNIFDRHLRPLFLQEKADAAPSQVAGGGTASVGRQ
jgi:hypothetical protein